MWISLGNSNKRMLGCRIGKLGLSGVSVIVSVVLALLSTVSGASIMGEAFDSVSKNGKF